MPLFKHFIHHFSENRNVSIDDEIYNLLTSYHWHGNVRELKNLAKRLVIMCGDNSITLNRLPNEMFAKEKH